MKPDRHRDPCTGLRRREDLEQGLEVALATAKRWKQRHALCFIDVNQFKAMNDACGYEAGDTVLRDMVAVMQRILPASAALTRLGGDEFGVLLGNCALEEAGQIAEELARAVAEYRYDHGDRTFTFTLGIGVVEISRLSGSVANVMNAAVDACVAAKSRAMPVFYAGMPDPVAARYGRAIGELTRIFLPRCADRSTLIELQEMASDPERWRHAHALFYRIREKTLAADAAHDRRLAHQYCFEEICAKSLYNLSGQVSGGDWPFRFDRDSPSWLVRNAADFANLLGIEAVESVLARLEQARTVDGSRGE